MVQDRDIFPSVWNVWLDWWYSFGPDDPMQSERCPIEAGGAPEVPEWVGLQLMLE